MKFSRQFIAVGYFLTALSITLIPNTAKADTILGVYVSASSWLANFSGTINNAGGNIDIEQELDIDDEGSTSFSIALEHPLPFIPNIKLVQTSLDISSNTVISSGISFGGIDFPTLTSLETQIDLSHNDIILYYEILDNWVSLDLGLALLNFDGNILLESSTLSTNTDLDEYIPTGYIKARFDLPFTGAYAGVEGTFLTIGSDATVSDVTLNLGYESSYGLGAEIGYHRFGADWNDIENSDGNLALDGFYASVIYHF